MRWTSPPALALGVLMLSPGFASAQTTIGATLASSGAIQASDATVTLQATAGQAFVGVSSDGFSTLKLGFWYPSGPGSRPLAALPPAFFGDPPAAEALQNEAYSAVIRAQDPNGDAIAFGIDPPLPVGLTFTDIGDNTATIAGTPGQAAVGPAVEYTVEASDGALTATLVFSLEVVDVNDIPSAPQVTTPAPEEEVYVTSDPDAVLHVAWTASTDPDPGDVITYRWRVNEHPNFLVPDLLRRETMENQVDVSFSDLGHVLDSLGVGPDAAVTLYHAVVATDGNSGIQGNVLLMTLRNGLATGLADDAIPDRFELRQNYPNPFNPTTTIEYDLPAATTVRFEVFDMLGRLVGRDNLGPKPAGRFVMEFDASALPSGVYFYTIRTDDNSDSRRLVVLK